MQNTSMSPGATLQNGKYRIIKNLGQGGFGITYLAEQVGLDRKVAIKEFFMKEYCNREGTSSRVSVGSDGSRELVGRFRMKFIKEAQMIASFKKCPHIVNIIDVFEENDTAYYVMEHIPGGSLSDLLKMRGPFPATLAQKYVGQVASALEYIHGRNVLHLDVKPSNILLDEDGDTVLIDFGISKHYDAGGSQTSSTPVGLSKGYAPLEQYQQVDIVKFSPSSDIYSLGATLYALVTGCTPPSATDVYEDGLPSLPQSVPSNIRFAIEKAMQPKKKDRPQSVAEFMNLLDLKFEKEGMTTDQNDVEETVIVEKKEPQKPSTISLSKHKPILAICLIALVSGLFMFLLIRSIGTSRRGELETYTDVQERVFSADSSDVAIEVEHEILDSQPVTITLKSISLNKSSLNLEAGQNASLRVAYSPSDATDKTTTWRSSDPKVASVSASGKVEGIGAGSATIIAICGGCKSECKVTVTANPVPVQAPADTTVYLTSITLNKNTLVLKEGESANLIVSYYPENASYGKTNWSTGNSNVATVSSNGQVKAVGTGGTSIIAKCSGKEAICNITVEKTVSASTESDEDAIPFQLVEVKPRFNGGDANQFSNWVNSQLDYPKIAKENGVTGKVVLRFTVNTDGSVTNVKVIRGVDPSLDREAVRVVSSSPKWEPGRHKGYPVKVTYTFPVIFMLT